MVSTDFNGEPILILSKTEAKWLLSFIDEHWPNHSTFPGSMVDRVSRKAKEVVDG